MSNKKIRTGVIGHPIGHSLSPAIHRHWMGVYQIDGAYDPIDLVPGEVLVRAAELLDPDKGGYAGLNVTVPHKAAIMGLCDALTPEARAIGAANTLLMDGGVMVGYNTDAYGFMTSLTAGAPGFDPRAGRAVVLGAGGAARAVAHALTTAGVPELCVVNRSRDKAEAIPGARAENWVNRDAALRGANLLVNTTSLGMAGKPPLELDLGALPRQAVVCDIVYAPLMTGLLTRARARGNRVVTGIGMLLHQAAGAFEVWHGVRPAVTRELEALVLAR